MNNYVKRLYLKIGVSVLIVVIIGFFILALTKNNNRMDIAKFAIENSSGVSELQIIDVKLGAGEPVKAGDLVSVHYVGVLTDGSLFDSSKEDVAKEFGTYDPRREYSAFQFLVGVGQVIKGWDQGLVGMKIGGVRRLVIPASLGYGERAIGPIPAGATLVFEVELLNINN